jgi:hypothetical protein
LPSRFGFLKFNFYLSDEQGQKTAQSGDTEGFAQAISSSLKPGVMDILKSILTAVAVIVIIAGIGTYFLPNYFSVSDSIEIDKPASVVYAELSDFNKWSEWDGANNIEPKLEATFEGNPGKPGHKMTWRGEKIGAASLTVTSAVANQSMEGILKFGQPFKLSSNDHWKLSQAGNKTWVTWTTEGKLNYPFGRLFGIKVPKTLDAEKKQSLDNLKRLCESMPSEARAENTSEDVPM